MSFTDRVLDKSGEISIEYIGFRKWNVILVADAMDMEESVRLSHAIMSCQHDTIVGIAFEDCRDSDIEELSTRPDELLSYFSRNCWRHACVTTPEFDFIYYKDEYNHYHLVCGSNEFLSRFSGLTVDAVKQAFFDFFDKNPVFTESEQHVFRRLWCKYYDGVAQPLL